MKQLLYISAAILALTGASCSSNNDSPVARDKSNAIGFRTYVDQTKASVATLDQLEADSFVVYTARHEGDYANQPFRFMEDQMVYHVDEPEGPGYWDYAPYRYWPENGDKLSFLAFSPHYVGPNGHFEVGDSDLLTIHYTTADAPSDQVDLMFAGAMNQSKSSNGGAVHFQFQHLLSKIGFAVYPMIELNDRMTMTVNKLSISYGPNLGKKGSSAYRESGWRFDPEVRFDTTVKHDIVSEDIAVLPYEQPAIANVVSTRGSVSAARQTSMHPEGANNYLMLLPQTVTKESMKIYVEYTITAREPDGQGGYTEVASYTKKASADLPETEREWYPNQQYTYVIGLDMDLIEFGTPTVSDWSTTPVEPQDVF